MSMSRLMAFDLEHASRGCPKHEAIKEYFVHQMETGYLKPGGALPTEQALVESLGVARSTIRQAMAGLERDGLVCRVRGKGTFVQESVNHLTQKVFALVVPDTRTGFYPSLLHGFEESSREVLHQVAFCNTEDNVDKQASVILQLIDRKVDGVVIVPATDPATPAHQIRQLQRNGIPAVFCHRSVEGVQAPLISLPHKEIGYWAGKKFVEHGHRRVAFLSLPLCENSTQGYRPGLQAALREAEIDLPEEYSWFGSSHLPEVLEREAPKVLEALFSRSDPPTAIFASFDPLAEIIYLLLGSMGLRVPEDVSLIGVGGTQREGVIMRRLTSIVVDEAATGCRAVELLTEMCQEKRSITDSQQFTMPFALSDGQTLGPAPRE